MCSPSVETWAEVFTHWTLLLIISNGHFSHWSASELQLWKQWRGFSTGHLGIKRHLNITMLANSFSTVPSRVNLVDWGRIVRDLEAIIVLVLLVFNFILHKSHHILTLFRSRFRDSVTATLWPWDSKQLPKHSRKHNGNACSRVLRKYPPRCTGRTTAGPKLFPEALLTPC